MTTLTVTSRGQVTFKKDVLRRLGIRPGDKIHLDLLPNGRAELKAEKPQGAWRDLQGVLKNKTNGNNGDMITNTKIAFPGIVLRFCLVFYN